MQLKKLLILFGIAFSTLPVFSQKIEKENGLSPFSFSTTLDLAYSPKSDYIPGFTHFSNIISPYSSFAGRLLGLAKYNISAPLGDHWLLKDSNFNIKAITELSPVTLKQEISADYTPFPFLILNSGFQIGTGWDFFDAKGLAFQELNISSIPFANYLIKIFIEATVQFDTAAIWPGDWNHFQIMYTFQNYYQAVTSANNGQLWIWQNNKNNTNGFSNYHTLITAFQMPLFISRVGLMFEAEGHYSNSDFSPYSKYNGAVQTYTISPLAQFTIGKKDEITFLFSFSSRQSFLEPHNLPEEEPYLTFSGYEWFFYRCVLRWIHNY